MPLSFYERVAGYLVVALIASLPFFSIRNSILVLSPPLIVSLIIIASVGLRSLFTLNLTMHISKLDMALFFYIGMVLTSLMTTPNLEGAKFAFVKTVIYFAAYLALKIHLDSLSFRQVEASIKAGVLLGTVSFIGLSLFCLAYTGQLAVLYTKLNYYSTVLTIFSSIDSVFGGDRADTFESKNVMRNAVAEAFTFYFLATMIFTFRKAVIQYFVLGMNLFYVVFMFSRRAFLGIVFGVLGGTVFRGRGWQKGLATLGIAVGVTLATISMQEETRLTDASDGGRLEQFTEALELFTSAPILGQGYAVKLQRETYVHNFVFASAAMLGIVGLLLALYIYTSAILAYLYGVAKAQHRDTFLLLVIPILGMSFGATVEGIFTITAWISFAIHEVCTAKFTRLDMS